MQSEDHERRKGSVTDSMEGEPEVSSADDYSLAAPAQVALIALGAGGNRLAAGHRSPETEDKIRVHTERVIDPRPAESLSIRVSHAQ